MIVNSFKERLLKGNINLEADTIKAMLLTSAHTTNIDTQEFISQVSANQVTGTGYTAGGATLASKAVTTNLTTDTSVFTAANVTWSNSTITARFVAIYKDTGTAATSPLIAIIDFGSNRSSEAADFTIQWNAAGIINLT